MTRAAHRRRASPGGPILTFVGGSLAALGSALTWAGYSVHGREFSTGGLDLTEGWITLTGGAVMAGAAVVMLSLRSRRVGASLALLAMLGALVAGGVSVFDAVTATESVRDAVAEEVAGREGVSVEEARDRVDQSIDAGQLTVSVEAGLSVVVAGAALGFLGGILALAQAPSRRPKTPPRPLRGPVPLQASTLPWNPAPPIGSAPSWAEAAPGLPRQPVPPRPPEGADRPPDDRGAESGPP